MSKRLSITRPLKLSTIRSVGFHNCICDRKPEFISISKITDSDGKHGAIYISDEDTAKCPSALTPYKIGAIISITDYGDTIAFEGYTCPILHFSIDDSPLVKITPYLDRIHDFIRLVEGNGRNVLVHCHMGVSRSPTVVISYLMKKWRKSFEEVYQYIKNKREVQPNGGYIQELQALSRQYVGK